MDDLRQLGFNVARPVEVAQGIGALVLTREQKAGLLRRYLAETGIPMNEAIRNAAGLYKEAL